ARDARRPQQAGVSEAWDAVPLPSLSAPRLSAPPVALVAWSTPRQLTRSPHRPTTAKATEAPGESDETLEAVRHGGDHRPEAVRHLVEDYSAALSSSED